MREDGLETQQRHLIKLNTPKIFTPVALFEHRSTCDRERAWMRSCACLCAEIQKICEWKLLSELP